MHITTVQILETNPDKLENLPLTNRNTIHTSLTGNPPNYKPEAEYNTECTSNDNDN